MDILSDETVIALLRSREMNGEVAYEALCECLRRGLLKMHRKAA